MTTCLIVTIYERPDLLRECLRSLTQLSEHPDYSIYIDDASKDKYVSWYINTAKEYYNKVGNDRCHVYIKEKNKGIKDSLLQGFESAFEKGADLAINLDGDAIVKPDFITRLKDLKTRFPDRIISGFNCNHPKNPVLFDGGDYVERKHANGINMCINRNDYENIVRPALLSQNTNWDYASTNDKNFIITKGSVVDHLGWNQSTMGHGLSGDGDRACDF